METYAALTNSKIAINQSAADLKQRINTKETLDESSSGFDVTRRKLAETGNTSTG
jgi:hypothetical protein